MVALRVFVSSTCVDLGIHREQIRGLLTRMGYDPLMSDFADVLYDPRKHTHTSCIREVAGADMVILMIGSRFGGEAVPEALGEVDAANIAATTSKAQHLDNETKYSITQLEAMSAINLGIPLITFVDSRVYADHHTYIKNKDHKFIDEIEFPSIQKPKTAKYIFDFISFITHMSSNNAILPFSSFSEIETCLIKQWSSLFQTLLREARERRFDGRKADAILEQLQDLKAAVLQTIDSDAARSIARSVLKFRTLADFLSAMKSFSPAFDVANYKGDFEDLLSEYDVVQTSAEPMGRVGPSPRVILMRSDGTFLRTRISIRRFEQLSLEWHQFSSLDHDTKVAVLDGVEEAGSFTPSVVRIADPSLFIDTTSEMPDSLVLPAEDDTPAPSGWTDERIAVLIKMWDGGCTASQIADELGGVSRNAVIGKAHRLGMKSRPFPITDA